MTGNNPTDRSKLGTKRHILTDKEGIPLSVVISPAITHDLNLVTDVVDKAVIKRSKSLSRSKPKSRRIRNARRKRLLQHLCLDKGYKSAEEEKKLIKRGYILHIPLKKKRGEEKDDEQKPKPIPFRKKYSAKRWVVYRKN